MTPHRFARIVQLIDTADSPQELAGLRWNLQQQDEWTSPVIDHFQKVAVLKGWWPVPEFGE